MKIEDINFAKLGYKIKLISESSIIDNKISNFTSPLISYKNSLANVGDALNAINISTEHLENLCLEVKGQEENQQLTQFYLICMIFHKMMNLTI